MTQFKMKHECKKELHDMARRRRMDLPGYPQHIIIRGNNRQTIFIADEDYHYYLEKLQEASERHNCAIHAYVLMSNHVHLLITPQQAGSIGKVMQSVGRCYVQYFNYSYQRTGTLWEGRYKSILIDSDRYALTCYRYIELNPVRAGMVNSPADYLWTSYHHNALGHEDLLITPHSLYLALSDELETRQSRYRDLFKTAVDAKQLEEIRSCTNKGWALGSERFKQEAEAMLNLRLTPKQRGGDRRSKQYKQSRKGDKRCFN
jgi:putative transposase